MDKMEMDDVNLIVVVIGNDTPITFRKIFASPDTEGCDKKTLGIKVLNTFQSHFISVIYRQYRKFEQPESRFRYPG
jgi:hypothetical protein